jgi:hypothetical protein
VKVSEGGVTPAIGTMPVPFSVTVCGLLGSVSAIVSAAGPRAPVAVGVKVTLMVQLEAAARLPTQLLVCAKSPGFVPAIVMLLIVMAVLPEFDSVTG